MERRGKVFYINLSHRTDRKEQIEDELSVFNLLEIVPERIDAVLDSENGALGCASSHIKAISSFLYQPTTEWAFFFEDDFTWSLARRDVAAKLKRIIELHLGIDAVLLSYNKPIAARLEQSGFIRIYSAQTMSGYFLTRRFAYELLKQLIDAHATLVACRHIRPVQVANSIGAIDVVWKPLLARSRVFGITPAMGIQRPSFSDIEKQHVDYGV